MDRIAQHPKLFSYSSLSPTIPYTLFFSESTGNTEVFDGAGITQTDVLSTDDDLEDLYTLMEHYQRAPEFFPGKNSPWNLIFNDGLVHSSRAPIFYINLFKFWL